MRRLKACLVAVMALSLAACAPSGPPTTTSVRAQGDTRTGASVHQQILADYGGAYRGPVADYVRDLGARLATVSEQPGAAWTFTTLDTPTVNAFAVPGGYIYVTRGLVALADNEAELAGVIGHEIGHVTAGHSAERRTSATIAQAGVLAAVLGAAVLGADGAMLEAIGGAGSTIGQGTIAAYGRAQELEADRLGVRYLARAGYDPTAQSDFLLSLAAQSTLQAEIAGQRYDPNRVDFFATHPPTNQRAQEAAAAIAAEGIAPGGATRVGREDFLRAVDGMTYGDSAAQGFVRGRRFIHPELRFLFEAPEGWRVTNSARAVAMAGPGGRLVFDGDRDPGGPLDRYLSADWAAAIARDRRTGELQGLQTFTIDGLEAAAAWLPVAVRDGTAVMRLTAIRAGDGRLWRFAGIVDPGDNAAIAAVRDGPRSFQRLSAEQARGYRPWRVAVRTVRPGDTVASLAARMPFDTAREARFRVLNDLAPNEGLTVGQQVKLVVE
jgi:predicted Zn-dependent protease